MRSLQAPRHAVHIVYHCIRAGMVPQVPGLALAATASKVYDTWTTSTVVFLSCTLPDE